jgi:phenylalanine-4-hydroxylase
MMSRMHRSFTGVVLHTRTTARVLRRIGGPHIMAFSSLAGVERLNHANLIHPHPPPHGTSTRILDKNPHPECKLTTNDQATTIPALQQDAGSVEQEAAVAPWIDNREEGPPRTSLLMELTDRVGMLHDVLKYFWKHDINIIRIESRPKYIGEKGQNFDFFIDMEGSTADENVQKLIATLTGMTERLLILDEKTVEWFPRHISELDRIANRTMNAGTDLEADHPGFHDPVYRARREALAVAARSYTWDQPIGMVNYTPEETSVWTAVWDRMEPLLEQYACQEYKTALEHMKQHCGYGRDRIPQQRDISAYLLQRTNFRMRPVAGLLSSRDFLNGLAFRVFFSTQYIRHHGRPLYTPEPDVCHELLGHAPMFADRDFADFSQEIGLASLGASDEDVDKLAHVRE